MNASQKTQALDHIDSLPRSTDAEKADYHMALADYFRGQGFPGSANHHAELSDSYRQRADEQAGFIADGEAIKAQEAEQARRDDQEVLERFTSGHNVIVGAGGRPWWAKSGSIERTLQPHELDALDRLEKRGVVSMNTKRYAI